MKRLLGILLLLIMAFSLGACLAQQTRTSEIQEYTQYLAKVEYAEEFMPRIEACGRYSSFVATYKAVHGLFETYTVGLFLTYGEEEYREQKQAIESSYAFFCAEDEDLTSDCDGAVGNYMIRLVDGDYPLETYKMGLLIGTSDAERAICYLFYYDFDLDILDDLDAYVRSYVYIP